MSEIAAIHAHQSEWRVIVEQVFEVYWASVSHGCYVGWDRGRYVAAPLSFEIGQMRSSDGFIVSMYTSHRGRLAMVMWSVAALQHQYHMQSVMEDPEWHSLRRARASNIEEEWSWYWF